MTRRHRVAGLLAIVMTLALLADGRLEAHSGLRFSSPLAGATLGASPTYVQLTFLEKPELSLSTLSVVDTTGVAYQSSRPEAVEGDPLSMIVRVRPLGRGVYTVQWRVVSAVDGHAGGGAFVFGVLMEPTGGVQPSSTDGAPSTLESVARSLLLIGLVLAFGAAMAVPLRYGVGHELLIAGVGFAVAIAGLTLLATAQADAAGVGFRELAATAIGRALLWRSLAIGAGLAFTAAAAGANRAGHTRMVALALTLAAVALLAAITIHAAAGHAAAGRWPIALTVAVQVAHFVAAALWIGGLATLAAGLRGRPSIARTHAITRFSSLAAISLLIVIATGVVRSAQEISAWHELISTAYGRVLLAKTVLLAMIAALGAVNRWRNIHMTATTLSPLRRVAGCELMLAGGALTAAGLLGTLPPPAAGRSIAGIEASAVDFGTTVRVRLSAASNQPGPNRFDVAVDDYDSRTPVNGRVTLRFTPTDDPGVASTTLKLERGLDAVYSGTGANLAFDGRWRIVVLIERENSSVEVPVEIEVQGRPQFLSVLRPPGAPATYTTEIEGLGFLRISPESERAGPVRLHITGLNIIYEELSVAEIVVTAKSKTKSVTQLAVERRNRNEFIATTEFTEGDNYISVVARAVDGSRLRASIAINVP